MATFRLKSQELGWGVIVLALFALHVLSALNFRFESFDGGRVLYHIMNGSPSESYINGRLLYKLTQFPGYLTGVFKAWDIPFGVMYLVYSVIVTFLPGVLHGLAWLCLPRQHRSLGAIILFSYILNVLPQSGFHFSLLPEAMGLAWISLVLFSFPPERLNGRALLLIVACFWYPLGYETIWFVHLLLAAKFIHILRSSTASRFSKVLLSTCMVLVLSLTVYRIKGLHHPGLIETARRNLLTFFPLSIMVYLFTLLALAFLLMISWKRRKWISDPHVHEVLGCALFVILLVIVGFYGEHPTKLGALRMSFDLRYLCCLGGMLVMLLFLNFNDGLLRQESKPFLMISIFLILVWGPFDYLATQDWKLERAHVEEKVILAPTGCSFISGTGWDFGMRSIIIQQSFTPAKVLFNEHHPWYSDDVTKKACDGYHENDLVIPFGLRNEFTRLIVAPSVSHR